MLAYFKRFYGLNAITQALFWAWRFICVATLNKEYLLLCPLIKKIASHAAAPGDAQTFTTPLLWEGERWSDVFVLISRAVYGSG